MKIKHRNIIVTEEQYRKIEENFDNDFSYISDNDTKHCSGNTDITVDGRIEDGVNGDTVTTDMIQQSLTPQSWNRYRQYGNIYPRTMRENYDINSADDIGETDAFDSLELQGNMLTQIPQTVQDRLKKFLSSVQDQNLTPKKKAILLNTLVKNLSSNTNFPTQKALDKGINKNTQISSQLKKNISNND